MRRGSMCGAALAVLSAASLRAPAQEGAREPRPLRFERVVLNEGSDFEAAGVADFDQDGDSDVICGDSWYAAPSWERRRVRSIASEGGYRLDFANEPLDVDGDGFPDVVSCNWHRRTVTWRRNPGKAAAAAGPVEWADGAEWIETTIDEPGNMETALAVDVDGDGRLDFLPDVQQRVVWYRVEGGALVRHEIAEQGGGHGIGFGDVDGDGRGDVIEPTGWYSAPAALEDRRGGGWTFHADFDLGAVGIGIVAHDFTGDGLPDLFAGMGHDYGTFWLEQKRGEDGARSFVRREVDRDWSQAHALRLADLDGDGVPEVVTGKRKYAHETDPGAEDEMVIFAYRFDRVTKAFARETIHRGGRGSGLGLAPAIADLDRDGDLDLVAPGKGGLYLFMQAGAPGAGASR